ncbi:MAG: hypothetical protein U1E87_00280 [Alphaproteobacteria bacterium]
MQDIAQCAQISSGELRLICYDAAARAIGNLAPPTPPAAATAPQAGATEPSSPVASQAPVAAPVPAAPIATVAQAPAPKKKSKGWLPSFGLFGTSKDENTQVAAAQSAPPRTPEDAFGAGRLPKTETELSKPKGVSSIQSTVTDYAYTPFGRIIVFLENGQVWRQIDGDAKKLRLRKGQTYVATIEKGSLGSFDLEIDGVDGFVKVTRIK